MGASGCRRNSSEAAVVLRLETLACWWGQRGRGQVGDCEMGKLDGQKGVKREMRNEGQLATFLACILGGVLFS